VRSDQGLVAPGSADRVDAGEPPECLRAVETDRIRSNGFDSCPERLRAVVGVVEPNGGSGSSSTDEETLTSGSSLVQRRWVSRSIMQFSLAPQSAGHALARAVPHAVAEEETARLLKPNAGGGRNQPDDLPVPGSCAASEEGGSESARVLVIDDDDVLLAVVRLALAKHVARSGARFGAFKRRTPLVCRLARQLRHVAACGASKLGYRLQIHDFSGSGPSFDTPHGRPGLARRRRCNCGHAASDSAPGFREVR